MFCLVASRFKCSASPFHLKPVHNPSPAGACRRLCLPAVHTRRSIRSGAGFMNRGPSIRRHARYLALALALAVTSMALPASGALAQGGVQIQVLGQGVQATAGGGNLVNPVTSVSTTVTLAANEWTGGYYQGNGVWYGRPWTALYGSQ